MIEYEPSESTLDETKINKIFHESLPSRMHKVLVSQNLSHVQYIYIALYNSQVTARW